MQHAWKRTEMPVESRWENLKEKDLAVDEQNKAARNKTSRRFTQLVVAY
jgi:hypothetical protein